MIWFSECGCWTEERAYWWWHPTCWLWWCSAHSSAWRAWQVGRLLNQILGVPSSTWQPSTCLFKFFTQWKFSRRFSHACIDYVYFLVLQIYSNLLWCLPNCSPCVYVKTHKDYHKNLTMYSKKQPRWKPQHDFPKAKL